MTVVRNHPIWTIVGVLVALGLVAILCFAGVMYGPDLVQSAGNLLDRNAADEAVEEPANPDGEGVVANDCDPGQRVGNFECSPSAEWVYAPEALEDTANETNAGEEAGEDSNSRLDVGDGETPETQVGDNELVVADGCQPVTLYDRPPQPQIGHPSVYLETGVNTRTICWSVDVKDGFVLVVGGFSVDGQSNGVYKAVEGPEQVTVRVTDGFIAIPVAENAEAEFEFRLGQAVEFGWAHEHVDPLPGWNVEIGTIGVTADDGQVSGGGDEVATTEEDVDTCADGERQETGQNASLPFEQGQTVFGWSITLEDGQVCEDGNCYLPDAPQSGTVTSGVVCPWPAEVEGLDPWRPTP